MALPSTVYRVTIELSNVDRGVYEPLTATVARHPSETAERLVTRLLAYALFQEPDLLFTKGVSAGDEPDLWVKGADGRVLLWIEVGLPEPERLLKACRHAERVVLVACGNGLPQWERQQLPKLAAPSNLTVLSFEKSFIARLASLAERVISWQFTLSDGVIYLTVAGETLETVPAVRIGTY
jgi:uncharacterized protein YaeQ